MRVSSPRRRRGVLFAWAAGVAVALVARAPLAQAYEPPPVFRAFDIQWTDATMPTGWKLSAEAAGDADAKPVKDALLAIAREKGLATQTTSKVDFVTQSATTAEGAKAVFVYLDLDEKSDAFESALKEAGATKGWDVKPLGAPSRLVVVSAPQEARAKALEAAVQNAARRLATMAIAALETRAGQTRVDQCGKAALSLDGKLALGHLALAYAAQGRYAQSKDAKDIEDGVQHIRTAQSKDATGEFTAKHRTMSFGLLGYLLLNKSGSDAEGRDALKEAVAGASNVDVERAMEYRYNLACAHARLKEADEAFKVLTGVLEDAAKNSMGDYSQMFVKDTDFTSIQGDARWEALKKKYGPAAKVSNDGMWR